jgi:hypothetical protein
MGGARSTNVGKEERVSYFWKRQKKTTRNTKTLVVVDHGEIRFEGV